MEFRLALFFLSFYYLRPQDWVPGLAGLNLVEPIIGTWIIVLLVYRSQASPLPGLLRTPHDWLMLTYFVYIMWTTPDWNYAFSDILSLTVFYALTVQSLTSWSRIYEFLRWWNAMILAVATIALLSLIGIDPTGAVELTQSKAGRLSIGTWLHNNPNALGHTVVAVLPLSYLLFFWKGTVSGRFLIFPLCFFLAGATAWQTESKGAFLVGAGTILLLFVIGRHRIVQISTIVIALTVGISGLSFLPRMEHMGDIQSDEGVIGRVMAWEMARTATREYPTGVGYRQFKALIDWVDGTRVYHDIPKATHCSYVSIGADLGGYGLFIYLALLWVSFRSILFLKTGSDLEERCRRAILILLAANVVSGWMINRGYHTEYFLLIAVAGAVHRLRVAEYLAKKTEEENVEETDAEPEWLGAPAGGLAVAGSTGQGGVAFPPSAFSVSPLLDQQEPHRPSRGQAKRTRRSKSEPLKVPWNRLGLIDIGVTMALTWLVFTIWDYVITMI
ncbi:MAG: hypothetical protein KDL87_02045 [Verrucomicrobiae bacterium]|nr:hypothetical protein [Verrucomicrobiae bacterium]